MEGEAQLSLDSGRRLGTASPSMGGIDGVKEHKNDVQNERAISGIVNCCT